MYLPAYDGLDVIRDTNWKPVLKGLNGWFAYARKETAKKSKRDNFNWNGLVLYVKDRNAFRISYAGQPYIIMKG